MVKVTRSPDPPKSLAEESKKKNGKYNLPDVTRQLKLDFHGKCYLCEIDHLQSEEVEHLCPKANRPEVKFDWNNLFYSCRHCNSVKNQKKYDGMILDCCREEPENSLKHTLVFRKENGITTAHVEVRPAAESAPETVKRTAELITECFELRNTGARINECEERVNQLQNEMKRLDAKLQTYLRKIRKNEPVTRTVNTLKGMLDRSYPFAGFLRTYVRENIDKYPALGEYVKL